jgi:hypothetical protein
MRPHLLCMLTWIDRLRPPSGCAWDIVLAAGTGAPKAWRLRYWLVRDRLK